MRTHSFPHLVLAGLLLGQVDRVAASDNEFTAQVILIVDESGSMNGRQEWLGRALPMLGKALEERNHNLSPQRVEYTLSGFTTDSRNLAHQSSISVAAGAVQDLRNDGGTEDGYVGVRDVLYRHKKFDSGPSTVILITDEDRDDTDSQLSLADLADFMNARATILHAAIPARIECNDGISGIAIDAEKTALTPYVDAPISCVEADIQASDDYAELAWETGGLVWDLNRIAPKFNVRSNADYLAPFVTALADRIVSQWPSGPPWINIEYWPLEPRSGQVVTFDASQTMTDSPTGQASRWEWDLDGDGSVDEYGPVVSHVYSTPGYYRVALEISDDSNPPVSGKRTIALSVDN